MDNGGSYGLLGERKGRSVAANRILQIKRGILVKLTANELLMEGDHKNIKEPSGGSGKFYRDLHTPPPSHLPPPLANGDE